MRNILFRGKNTTTNEWEFGVPLNGRMATCDCEGPFPEIIPETQHPR